MPNAVWKPTYETNELPDRNNSLESWTDKLKKKNVEYRVMSGVFVTLRQGRHWTYITVVNFLNSNREITALSGINTFVLSEIVQSTGRNLTDTSDTSVTQLCK